MAFFYTLMLFYSAVKGLLGPLLIKEQQLAAKSLVYFRQLLFGPVVKGQLGPKLN
jgi:hypothetical protein